MQNESQQKKQQKKFRIKSGILTKLLIGIIVPLVVILTLVGIELNKGVEKSVVTLNDNYLESETLAAAKQLDSQLQRYMGMAEAMSRSKEVVQRISGWHAGFNGTGEKEETLDFLRTFQSSDDMIASTWIYNLNAKEILQSDGTYKNAAEFDATGRQWYDPIINGEKITATGAYEDVATGNLIVSFAVPVSAGNKLIGILGVDVLLDTFNDGASQITVGNTGYITIYDKDNNIIYHPDENLVLTNVEEVGYSDNIKKTILNNETAKMIEYTREDKVYNASTAYLENADYMVLGILPNEEYQKSITETARMIVFWFAAAIILLAIVVVILSLNMVKSVKILASVAGKIAEGELDVEVDVSSQDEVGRLANDIRAIVSRLKNYILYIDEITAVLKEIGRGNFVFTLKQDYQGEFGKVKTALLEVRSTISEALKSVVVAADQVASGADQIAVGAQAQAQGATEQASSVQELAANLQDVTQQIGENTQTILETGNLIDRVGEAVQVGEEKMKAMLGSMGDISENSEKVADIIKNIEDIAFQTNILAINAAVEAARAGEAGKGFAVVADEVRNLAGKTAEASKTTAELIQKALDAVEHGKVIAGETADSFETVYTSVAEVNTNAHRITENSSKQDEAIHQTTQGVDQISSVIQNNSATAEESAAASEELSGQAQMLKELVEEFKLPDDGPVYAEEPERFNGSIPAEPISMNDSKY